MAMQVKSLLERSALNGRISKLRAMRSAHSPTHHYLNEATTVRSGRSGLDAKYIQVNAAFVEALSPRDRKRYARYLYLLLRFQNLHIHGSLDHRTCRKAGLSQKTLRRWLKDLCRTDTPLRHLCLDTRKLDLQGRRKAKKENSQYVSIAERQQCYMLADRSVIELRIRQVLDHGPIAKARCTIWIGLEMEIQQIVNELEFKLLEEVVERTDYAMDVTRRRRGKGSRASGTSEQHASKTGRYPIHPSLKLLEPLAERRGVPVTSKIAAEKIGRSRRTLFRRMASWEKQGAILRTRRRVHLSEAEIGMNPMAFYREWGIMPFCVGGLWYGQATNKYTLLRDYQGPNALMRKQIKGYGLTVTEMYAKTRANATK